MSTMRLSLLIVIGLLLGVQESESIGRVYARIPNYANSPIYDLRIKTMQADVTIRDQLAVTHVDQVFANDNAYRLEGFYVFKLPEGAQVHEMYLWINGVRVPYVIKRREDAVVRYQEIVTRMQDPAILQQLGSNLFQLRIFPFDPMNTRRIEIQYSQPLTYYKGSIQYTFPLDMKDYISAPIEQASISMTLNSQIPVTAVETSADGSPTAVRVTKVDSMHWTVEYGVENMAFQKDFQVRCSLDRKGRSILGLTYAPPAPEEPYFITWSALPDTLYGDSVKARELTFVADVSSSMEGQRLQQLKDALLSFIDLLSDQDRFNIIAFSTTTVRFKPDLVPVTEATRAGARAFVAQMVALGLTNFEDALHDALSQTITDPGHAALIFVTDGQPSLGETRPDSLLAKTQRWNGGGVRLFPVGVGEETDYTLLQNLAQQNGGVFTAVAADDSVYLKVRDLYRLLFLPKLRGITMDYGTAGATDVHPAPIPDVYAGDQLLTTGRFSLYGTSTVTLSGTAGGQVYTVKDEVPFPDTATTFPAIGRYWGAQKIQSLLALIARMGPEQELIDQVIALSMKYSVLTPYTAFLVVEPAATGSTAVRENTTSPLSTGLAQNYPNPFNPSTTISYAVGPGAPRLVTLRIYDMLGRCVRSLVAEMQSSGVYHVVWDATDERGAKVASGLYLVRMSAGEFHATRTIVLLK